jgi:Glycosyl transferase family group 2
VRGLFLIAWFAPVAVALMIALGALVAHRTRTKQKRRRLQATIMIVQITTIGNEETVNEIVRTIRSYGLDFIKRIWVVTEPWSKAKYVGIDERIVVPEGFDCRAKYKARALEYSRRLRAARGLDREDVKIVFVDDDSLPTKRYLQKAFEADADVTEGITAPRRGYGRLLSHMDDLRTMNCLFACSIFQGMGHPIHVHGEGLCVRGSTEAIVTWDFPIFASEDLVFGHTARLRGMTWGFIWEYIQITSPYTWRDFLIQRQRWLWGNIHAIRHVLPLRTTWPVILKYAQGTFTFVVSTLGIFFALTGRLHAVKHLAPWLYGSLALWLVTFAFCGAINAGQSKGIRKLGNILAAPLLAWVTSAVAIGVLVVALFRGDPGRFEVIEKTDPKRKKPKPPADEDLTLILPDAESLQDIWR